MQLTDDIGYRSTLDSNLLCRLIEFYLSSSMVALSSYVVLVGMRATWIAQVLNCVPGDCSYIRTLGN